MSWKASRQGSRSQEAEELKETNRDPGWLEAGACPTLVRNRRSESFVHLLGRALAGFKRAFHGACQM
jgi:hypothetical protein